MVIIMKIVVLDGYTENPGDLSWEGFEKLGSLVVYDRTKTEEVVDRIGDAEIVITNKTPITKETLQASANIKYIGVLATGYNVVDVDAAKEKNIPVCNIPTYGTTAVAQMTMAMLLEVCHHVGAHADAVKSGEWSNCPDFCFWNYPLMELKGKVFGSIGFGRIGQESAKLAKAFGMEILAFDTYQTEQGKEIATYVDLETLLANADVISLHCPLFPSTEGIINKTTINQMKDGVIIINTSRGPLVVEEDLADGLNNGKIAYAALDVVATEPIKEDNCLLKCNNCIITPHIAWAPKESRQRLMDIAVDNLVKFIDGEPQNIVNK